MTFTTSALAAFLSVATFSTALAHGDHGPRAEGSMMDRGKCHVVAADTNMQQIESVFRSMPQATRMNLQHVLRHAGLYEGRDDGVWGPRTSCAIEAVAARYPGEMQSKEVISFFEYMLDGGFVSDYPGTPDGRPHEGLLY